LPSQSGETWGLVVNEAIQFGLRVIVSDKVGCAKDLIKDQSYGEVFTHGDLLELLECISRSINSEINKYLSSGNDFPQPSQLVEKVYFLQRTIL